MFGNLKSLPSDSILGLLARFRDDPRAEKIDLGVGVYKDEAGATPILAAVKQAERIRLERETTKSYIGPAGDAGYDWHMGRLVLGADLAGVDERRIGVVQTAGACAALRSIAGLVQRSSPGATVWVSDPTWANHALVLADAGLRISEYPYLDRGKNRIRFEEMTTCLAQRGPGDVVLLHGCCHNPCGADLSRAQWGRVLELAQRRGFTPFIDLAYQGFGEGLDADAYGVRLLAANLPELVVASSCSKNFGLYRERTGAAILISENAAHAEAAKSQLLNVISGIYAMPPAHGAALVDIVLSDAELRSQWTRELGEMRSRINDLRKLVASRFRAKGAGDRFDFIEHQLGMFSFLGIDERQIALLRERYAIYLVDSSRINVAGASHKNVDYLCESVLSVL